jgi:hypothetical protein
MMSVLDTSLEPLADKIMSMHACIVSGSYNIVYSAWNLPHGTWGYP